MKELVGFVNTRDCVLYERETRFICVSRGTGEQLNEGFLTKRKIN